MIRKAAVLLSAAVLFSNAIAEETELRIYGKVAAELQPARVQFSCQSAAQADMLLGKLLADLFWDAGANHHVEQVRVNGRDVPIHVYAPYGMLAALRSGDRVLALGAETPDALRAALEHEELTAEADARYEPEHPYPMALDFCDLRAAKVYIHAHTSVKGLGLASHWPFVKKFGLGGLSFQNASAEFTNPAPGVLQLYDPDCEVREAEREGGMVVPMIGSGAVPLWIYNRFPEDMIQSSPRAVLGLGPSGAHHLSWGAPADVREQTLVSYLRTVMARYGQSPSVGGWGLYAGAPFVEMAYHFRTTQYYDYAPAMQAAFRTWLRESRKLDLPALGARWHGDPAHFKTWDDVRIPDIDEFYGPLDESALVLQEGWTFQLAGDSQTPPANDQRWLACAMPPNQQQLFLPWGAAFYRVQFDATEWLRTHGPEVWLACAANCDLHAPQTYKLWLNGQALGEASSTSRAGPIALKLTGKLNAGINELVIRAPQGSSPFSEGKIYGPTFLLPHEPLSYPRLGPQANARFLDMKEGLLQAYMDLHRAILDGARSVDPGRWMILSPGPAEEQTTDAIQMCVDYGLTAQMTGREAWYHPWWPGLGVVAGFYGSGEPSGTTHGDNLTRMLGWVLYDGDSSHTLFWDLEDYIQEEQKSGWFTAHQRGLQAIGKALRFKPSVVLFRSARTLLLGFESPWNWDIGRGELQSAHYDFGYATERELRLGLLRDTRVIFDCGTEVMDDETVSELRRCVENGALLVALHNTGRHSPILADSAPLASLSGFRVGKAHQGKLRFGEALPILNDWSGKNVDGSGSVLDGAGREHAGAGAELESIADQAVVLAAWEDGSPAVGYRKVGKGGVLTLGSTFWRSGKDLAGVWRTQSELESAFLESVLRGAGVARDADASQREIWTRKFETKNGLQEWVVAFNSSDQPVTADIGVSAQRPPARVLDWMANAVVAHQFENGMASVKACAFAPYETKIFAVDRPSLCGGIATWWKEKTTYWRTHAHPQPTAAIAGQQDPDSPTLSFERWKFAEDQDGSIEAAGAWSRAGFDAQAWRELPLGPWAELLPELKNAQTSGLYRAAFQTLKPWHGRTVTLNLYSFNNPIASGDTVFLLNGKRVAEYHEHGGSQTLNYDVTELLQDGENVLAVRVKGGKSPGLYGAVWIGVEFQAQETLPLNGAWQACQGDYIKFSDVTLPGKLKAKYATRQLEAPEQWKDGRTILHIEAPNQSIACVNVNGYPILYTSYSHLFGTRAELDISTYLHYGASNRIELWPLKSIPRRGNPYDGTVSQLAPEVDFEVGAVLLKHCAATKK